MTTYRCAACSTVLEAEKLPLGNIVEVKPCEACLEAAEEAALDAADMEDFEQEMKRELQDQIVEKPLKVKLFRKEDKYNAGY